MLPRPVSDRVRAQLSEGLPPSLAWRFDAVCVLQSDIVGFTKLGSRATPEQLCRMLHELFSAFDEMSNVFGVYKIGAWLFCIHIYPCTTVDFYRESFRSPMSYSLAHSPPL